MLAGPPEGKSRTRTNAFIAAFAALQLVIPLRYYLSEDQYDERFSWRMFSGVRMQDCAVRFVEQRADAETELDLDRFLHVSWQTTFKRNREAVIWKFLEERCAQEGVTETRLISTCSRVDGTALPTVERSRTCASGEERERAVR